MTGFEKFFCVNFDNQESTIQYINSTTKQNNNKQQQNKQQQNNIPKKPINSTTIN